MPRTVYRCPAKFKVKADLYNIYNCCNNIFDKII